MLVLIYLVAIILANLSVAYFGPKTIIINAFLFIGLDLSCRDSLHDRWRHKNLWFKMFGLICAGSILTYALNQGAGRIALASVCAFSLAAISDAIVYSCLFHRAVLIRMNGSNVVSAAVDSIAFPTIAFGMFMPWIIFGQWMAKIGGGFVWSLILKRWMRT